jgi:hypothetical protein
MGSDHPDRIGNRGHCTRGRNDSRAGDIRRSLTRVPSGFSEFSGQAPARSAPCAEVQLSRILVLNATDMFPQMISLRRRAPDRRVAQARVVCASINAPPSPRPSGGSLVIIGPGSGLPGPIAFALPSGPITLAATRLNAFYCPGRMTSTMRMVVGSTSTI